MGTRRLKLRVNAAKSAVDQPERRKFLGFSFKTGAEPKRRIAPAALDRFKEQVRGLTGAVAGPRWMPLSEASLPI
jgi:RNA-directed DNA polymerase